MRGRKNQTRKRGRIWKWIGALLTAGILCFGGLVGYVVILESRVQKDASALEGDYDALIVLGAQVLPDGEPNTQLRWRLDAAKEAWEIHPAPIVVCGAQGKDEPVPEAEAMRNYLVRLGIPSGEIHMDPDSFNTSQNLRNAADILRTMPEVRKVLIITSDYHVPRAMALARDLDYETAGLGSPCKPEYWLKNHGREALSWLKYWLVKYLHLNL